MKSDLDVDLLASDSMGVRSMATSVNTHDLHIIIDPGAALGPMRFGLAPSRLELEALEKYSNVIAEKTMEADVLIISHYHYDHYSPSSDLFRGKRVCLKDTSVKINKSQRERGNALLSAMGDTTETFFSDGRTVEEGNTTISFSPPVPHGPEGTRLGYVIMTSISRGKNTVVHTSDVEGLLSEDTIEWIVDREPTLIIADGPPAYLAGYRFSHRDMEKSILSLRQLLEKTGCPLVLDHHLMRSEKYRNKMEGLWNANEERMKTFASYNGTNEELLEARRKELCHSGGKGGCEK